MERIDILLIVVGIYVMFVTIMQFVAIKKLVDKVAGLEAYSYEHMQEFVDMFVSDAALAREDFLSKFEVEKEDETVIELLSPDDEDLLDDGK